MSTVRRCLGALVSINVILGLCGCGEGTEPWDMAMWHAARLVAQEGTATLEINGDLVVFEGVPFEGSIAIVPEYLKFSGSGTYTGGTLTTEEQEAIVDGRMSPSMIPERAVSLVMNAPRGTIEISMGELRFVVTRRGEEVEFGGRRTRLTEGAKRVVFTSAGGVEVSDRE